MQFYTDSKSEEYTKNDTGIATRKFFLNCLLLLLGRLDAKQIERTMTEYGMQISHALIPQVGIFDLLQWAIYDVYWCLVSFRASTQNNILLFIYLFWSQTKNNILIRRKRYKGRGFLSTVLGFRKPKLKQTVINY